MPDDPPALVEERHVDREPHPEGVNGAAVRDQQRVVGRRRSHERESEETSPDRRRLVHDEPAREHAPRQAIEPSHTSKSAMGAALAPG